MIATIHHDDQTWHITSARIGLLGRELFAATTTAPGVIHPIRPGTSLWKAATALPEVRQALAEAEAKQATREAEEARRRAENERRTQEAEARNARLRAEAEERGRACYIRFGRLPRGGRSRNHRDGHAETGVSVYPAWRLGDRYVIDLRGLDAISAAFIIGSDTPVYRVTGTVLAERGADGEPLVADARARRIHPVEIEGVW